MRPLTTLFAPIAALLLSACAPPAAAGAEPRPAMWVVADEDTRIYLFGTVHLLPRDTVWRTPRFDRAFADADTLVLEVDMPADPASHAARYRALAAAPGLPPLLDRVPPARRGALARLIEDGGLRPAQLDGLKTWAAALAIGSTLYRDGGLSSAAGVESVLRREATAKRVVGLETLEQQLGFFDALAEGAQRDLLLGMVDEAAGAPTQFADMVAAWTSGDLATLAATYEQAEGLSPEVADALLARRNAAWSDWVRERLDVPGTVMVAVGAGHLAGDGSVIDRLGEMGLTVRRVQ